MGAGAMMVASLLPLGGGPYQAQFLPAPEDFRQQKISRSASETDWPFAEDSGILACVFVLGIRQVIFIPSSATFQAQTFGIDVPQEDILNVTTDPLLLFSQLGKDEHFAPGMKIEDKIRRLGPYVTLGKKLCDQPKGTIVGPGEL
jgi:hypothetical protein